MIAWLIYKIFGHKKFMPLMVTNSIYDVDYAQLYEEGCRIILTDLDNTLISYIENRPSLELKTWKENLQKIGFKLMIVSNSHSKRVTNFANEIGLNYQPSSFKPLKHGFKKVKKALNITTERVIVLGDQLLTDVLGANRMGFEPILIRAIDRKKERFSTRFNRFFEKRIVRLINKHEPDGVLKNYE